MEFKNFFSQQHIHKVLTSAFQYSDESGLSFLLENSNNDPEKFTLKVKYNNEEKKYSLIKIHKNTKIEKELQTENSKVLYPVFVLESNKKDNYGAFSNELENYGSPQDNNLIHLKIILENLAEYQALDLVNRKESCTKNPSEYNLKQLIDTVASLNILQDLDSAAIKNSAQSTHHAVNKLLNGSNLLVRSISCPFAKNVYVNQVINKSIFLNVASTKLLPPAYDALVYIFALSNEKFRQHHFETLVVQYFEYLAKFLQKFQSEISNQITTKSNENQVRVLLPVVKFEVASSLLELEESPKITEILTNLRNFLTYPLINQEDVYEISKNLLKTTEYNLLKYDLTSLSEKNGFLGDYYFLKIRIEIKGEIQEFTLFAKFMITPTEMMQELVDNGLVQREDFFYRTLVPLFNKSGLESLLDFAPKCYLSRVGWLLVLEDLSRQGYVGFRPNASLSYDGLVANIENLAKLHASSLLLEEILSRELGKKYRLDGSYPEFLTELVFIDGDETFTKVMHKANAKAVVHLIDKLPEVFRKLNLPLEKVKAEVEKRFLSLYSKVLKSDTIRNVVNHGDTYVANMLFKSDENDVIKKGVLIDFQVMRYTSPSYDLLFFLFNSTTKETRDKYLEVLIEHYYRHMTENLRKFDVDPEVVIPKETFYKDIQYMKDAAIMGTFSYYLVIHLDEDSKKKIFENQETVDYHFLHHHRSELVDLLWKHERPRNLLRGLMEDLADVMSLEN